MGYTAEKLIFIFFPQNFQLFLNTQVNVIRMYEPKVTRFDLAIFLWQFIYHNATPVCKRLFKSISAGINSK